MPNIHILYYILLKRQSYLKEKEFIFSICNTLNLVRYYTKLKVLRETKQILKFN